MTNYMVILATTISLVETEKIPFMAEKIMIIFLVKMEKIPFPVILEMITLKAGRTTTNSTVELEMMSFSVASEILPVKL